MRPDLEQKLETYRNLLIKWQKALNLVGPSTIPDIENRHFKDSLQIVDLLPAGKFTLADMGSGAGFPGMIIAMANEEAEIHLIESDEKKCTFLRTVSRETRTPVVIHNDRIEELAFRTDFITARALAPLEKLFTLSEKLILMNPDIKAFFLKGKKAGHEIEEARAGWSFDLTTHQSITNQDSCILEVKNILSH